VQRHIGYITSMPNIVGGGTYEDRYFLINAPQGTVFTLANVTHPAGYMDQIRITLGSGNYLSVCALQAASEASFYHENGYAFMAKSNVSYTIDRSTSVVHTSFRNNMQHVASGYSKTGVLALLPHQYKKTAVSLSTYTFRTVRGTLKMFSGNAFDTALNFRGLLPSFTTPTDSTYQESTIETYLADLDGRTGIEDEDFLGSPAPYWNAKALYPMSQALIISDQIGNETYKTIFKNKIKAVLVDWFTYDATNSEDRYLYYNQKWGTMYYSNNDFSTASELSDHHFTHGYLVYSAAVLSMYDSEFFSDYKDIIEFFLKDYMEPDEESAAFPELRCFDPWAGHSWAHGYGSFTEGNNQESSGEALNAWLAGYLFGLASSDTAMVDAAIYGFTTELYSIKQYWFNYDEDNWATEYSTYAHVAGMVWGGKYDYATWFGSNPTFIYGIHWLPTGEYLSSYALGTSDKAMLSTIYSKYLSAAGGAPNTWYSNMWAIQALVNPSTALSNFDSSAILGDDYPNELVGSYWMVHAMQTLKTHTDQAWMEVSSYVSSSVYDTGNGLVAMVWNSSDAARSVTFRNASGVLKTVVVGSRSFTQVTL
jgi:endo-1,3(4)-beta-glucanase